MKKPHRIFGFIGKVARVLFTFTSLRALSAQAGTEALLPKLSFVVRTDAIYEAYEGNGATQSDQGGTEPLRKPVVETWRFNLHDARLSLKGQIQDDFSYFLDLDLLGLSLSRSTLQNPMRGELEFRKKDREALAEAWAERLVLPFSIKAGRVFVRTGAFERDQSFVDTYQQNLVGLLTPAQALSGFEFGLLQSTTQIHAQVLEPLQPSNRRGLSGLSFASSVAGEYFDGHLTTVLSGALFDASGSELQTASEAVPTAAAEPEPETERLAEKSMIYQLHGGFGFNFEHVGLSLEYGRTQRDPGAIGYPALDGVERRSLLISELLKMNRVAALGQNGTLHVSFEIDAMRPLVAFCYDHFEAGGNFFGRSTCALAGLEYFPKQASYRTHLIFKGRHEVQENKVSFDTREVLFGVRFVL